MIFRDRAIQLENHLKSNYIVEDSMLNIVEREKRIQYPDSLLIKKEFTLNIVSKNEPHRIGYYEVSSNFNKSFYFNPDDINEDYEIYLTINILNLAAYCHVSNNELLNIVMELEIIRRFSERFIPGFKNNTLLEMVLKESKNEISPSFNYFFRFRNENGSEQHTIKIGENFNSKIFYQQYCSKIKEQFDIDLDYESFVDNAEESFKTFGLMIY